MKIGGAKAAEEAIAAQIREIWEEAFRLPSPSIPVKAAIRGGRAVFAAGPFIPAHGSSGLSFAAPADRLLALLPSSGAVYAGIESSGGYLNFIPSSLWYRQSAEGLFSLPAVSDRRHTEEDFCFFRDLPPRHVFIARSFVRLCSVLRNSAAEGHFSLAEADAGTLSHPAEEQLIFSLCRLREASGHALFHRLAETCQSWEDCFDRCRIWSEESSQTAARAKLYAACHSVLFEKMALIGLFQ